MRLEYLNELKERGIIHEEQYNNIEPIASRKIVSLFYELRILLYLGVMLFSTGVGILIYKNIGDLGHIIAIILLILLSGACFVFVFIKGKPYSNNQVETPSSYFEYILLLGCLIFLSILGYLQFQFGILTEFLNITALTTSIFFFYLAYRFDHLGILSLAITALASFFGLSLSYKRWYELDFLETANLHITAIIFGAALVSAALVANMKGIKKHFTFTFLNFSTLIFLSGALTGMFSGKNYLPFFLILIVGCASAVYFARWQKAFIFLLYAFVFGYAGFTYVVANIVDMDFFGWFFYLILSCGGFIYFIIRFKDYFKREK